MAPVLLKFSLGVPENWGTADSTQLQVVSQLDLSKASAAQKFWARYNVGKCAQGVLYKLTRLSSSALLSALDNARAKKVLVGPGQHPRQDAEDAVKNGA